MITIIKQSNVLRTTCLPALRCYSSKNEGDNIEKDEFRVLHLYKMKGRDQSERRKARIPENYVPRSKQMAIDQEWTWPGPRSFHPASVPLPLHQGFVVPTKAPPGKFANAELMKIPNFLHLTPPNISKQCEALKKFCTPWPKGLESEEVQEKHFPMQVISSDYVHGNPTIRNHLSRIMTIKFKLSLLDFNAREKDKFLRLVDQRYNAETDEVTITTDRCPIKQQNFDYAIYLITALYHESKTIEDWESSKVEADMETYIWENNKSKKVATEILNWNSTGNKISPPEDYAKSVEAIFNEGENEYNLNVYKESVTKMLGLKAQ